MEPRPPSGLDPSVSIAPIPPTRCLTVLACYAITLAPNRAIPAGSPSSTPGPIVLMSSTRNSSSRRSESSAETSCSCGPDSTDSTRTPIRRRIELSATPGSPMSTRSDYRSTVATSAMIQRSPSPATDPIGGRSSFLETSAITESGLSRSIAFPFRFLVRETPADVYLGLLSNSTRRAAAILAAIKSSHAALPPTRRPAITVSRKYERADNWPGSSQKQSTSV